MRVLAAVLSTNLRAKVKDEYRIKLVVDLGHGRCGRADVAGGVANCELEVEGSKAREPL